MVLYQNGEDDVQYLEELWDLYTARLWPEMLCLRYQFAHESVLRARWEDIAPPDSLSVPDDRLLPKVWDAELDLI